MTRSDLLKSLRLLPLFIASALAAIALAAVALAALSTQHHAVPETSTPFGDVMYALRSYQFRVALKNSIIVTTSVGVLVYLAARFVTPSLVPNRRRPRWISALLLSSLFLPVPIAAFIWRPLTDLLTISRLPGLALLSVVFVQTWRLWPLSIMTAMAGVSMSRLRNAIIASLIAVWFALIDVGTPLLVSGGEPFNSTHLLSTWAFHTVSVSRLWNYSAVLVGGIAALSTLLGLTIWLVLTRTPTCPSETQLRTRGSLPMYFALIITIIPILLSVAAIARQQQPVNLGDASLWRIYSRWLLNSACVVSISVLVARFATIGFWMVRRRQLLAIASLLGMTVTPILYWIAARWLLVDDGFTYLFIIGLVTGLTAGLLAAWPVSLIAARREYAQASGLRHMCVVAIASMLFTSQFAIGALFTGSPNWHTVGSGLSLHLTGETAFTHQLALASITTFVTTFAIIWALGRMPQLLRRP